MDKDVTTLDSVDGAQCTWVIVVEVDVLTLLSCHCWKLVLRIDGYGDVFARDELLLSDI